MTVLTIIGVIILAMVIYGIVEYINNYVYKKHQFDPFCERSAYIVIISYVLLVGGSFSYNSAVNHNGDELNGILIFAFGICGLIYMVRDNIKKSNLIFGLVLSVVQFLLYIPITCGFVIVLLGLLGAASNSKAIYNIDR